MITRPDRAFERDAMRWGAALLAAATLALAACSSSSHTRASSPTTTQFHATTVKPASTATATTPSTTNPAPVTTAPPITPTTAPPSKTAVATTSACATSELTISLGPAGGTAGSIHYPIVFHNASPAACDVYGYPGVSFLDGAGHQIGDPAQREPNETVQTVRLAPGADGYVDLSVTDPAVVGCSSPASPADVRVYPPGNTEPALVAAPPGMHVCGHGDTTRYTSASVSPVSSSEF